jgi:hypothetical protein
MRDTVPNKRMEPMTSSAITQVLQSSVVVALTEEAKAGL